MPHELRTDFDGDAMERAMNDAKDAIQRAGVLFCPAPKDGLPCIHCIAAAAGMALGLGVLHPSPEAFSLFFSAYQHMANKAAQQHGTPGVALIGMAQVKPGVPPGTAG